MGERLAQPVGQLQALIRISQVGLHLSPHYRTTLSRHGYDLPDETIGSLAVLLGVLDPRKSEEVT